MEIYHEVFGFQIKNTTTEAAAGLGHTTLLKIELHCWSFTLNFAKCFKTDFLLNTSGWFLLKCLSYSKVFWKYFDYNTSSFSFHFLLIYKGKNIGNSVWRTIWMIYNGKRYLDSLQTCKMESFATIVNGLLQSTPSWINAGVMYAHIS